MRPIRLATFALLAVAVFAMSACVSIRSQTLTQHDVIGDNEIATTICEDTSGSPAPSTGCPVSNNPSSATPTELLVAYRLPDGMRAPDSFVGTVDSPTPPEIQINFKKDKGYTDSLTAVAAPPAGEHWVGYRGDGTSGSDVNLNPRFGLPRPSDGHAFHGPLKYRTVVGFYSTSTPNAEDPVVCNADPTQPSTPNSNGSSSVCIDYPTGTDWQSDESFATRDLGIVPPAQTSAQQNSSTELTFTADYAGASTATATFSLTATTTAPDVMLKPSATSLTPATDSQTPITVAANVLPTTPAGTYAVTLTAKNAAGQTRTATTKLVVTLSKPLNLVLPFVNGTAAVGQTVSCDNGTWSSSPTSYAVQWTRDGADIPGATASTYTLTEADGAALVACRVTATNEVGDGAPATSGVVRIAQLGGASVDINGPVSIKKNSDGTYTVDTGITVDCPPRLPKNCGGSARITTDSASGSRLLASATKLLAKRGFSVKSGGNQKIVLKLTKRASKLLHVKRKIVLVGKVVTRNHKLQRVTTQKRFTVLPAL
jgi:hypothetical protein